MEPDLLLPIKIKRRRFTVEFKKSLVKASNAPNTSIAGIAQQHGINANLLHKWRKQYGDEVNDFVRLPVVDLPTVSGSEVIRIRLPDGIVVDWPIDQVQSSVNWLKAMMS